MDTQTDTGKASRRVTAKDIATSLGVSRATVGFVLNNTAGQTISEATRRRVIAEAHRLGYRPHSAARALASGRTNTVLLILPDWPIDFSVRNNIEEASNALDDAGYTLLITTPHDSGRARPLWETVDLDAVMGYLPFTPQAIEAMRAAGVTRIVPDPDTLAPPYDEPGTTMQVEHLADLGHRALAYADTADRRLTTLGQERWAAARLAAETAGCRIERAAIDLDNESATTAVLSWRAASVTGVLAYNDDVAAALVGAALRAGIDIPGELSVIGHDDAPIARLFEPRLSTIRLDTAGLGRQLAALTIASIEGSDTAPAEQATPTVQLIERDSTRAIPADKR
ncbi:LacI family DNA-binding transcriptional regulator [Okibacterium fritillariae]|uniref:DNA-binding transcriptional regulator, LacI/PurR family n=1 Tax=Okibacterium fritillariae TaxID=123320 RepID=A0A1T5KZ48_9MICO|nr:LacI family DNA-binding transcriptional regulator [Okibacterium fritillariae]SKC69066.1 DNA-binding transcriptional regulator, LacI/PurR family [Okibacterium fritillariae]